MINQEEFHRKVCNGDFQEFDGFLYQINSNLGLFTDKQQLWDDLITLAIKGLPNIRWNSIFNLGFVFPYVPNRQKSWEDLITFLSSEDLIMRWSASFALGLSFSYIPNKNEAWKILHELSFDNDPFVREGAAFTFISAFQQIHYKETAWKDIRRLLQDQHAETRKYATLAVGPALLNISDDQIFTVLYKLAEDENGSVRASTANVLGFALTHFSEISNAPDKREIWKALHILTDDEDEKVRSEVAHSLRHNFPSIPDRQQAWEDLNRLISDKNNRVRGEATYSLGRVFRYAPDEKQIWEKLHSLVNDDSPGVRGSAASAIGMSFTDISNKKQALDDLVRLVSDENKSVRRSANHSLGSVSIFNACDSESDKEYIIGLEKAIEFFEKSIEEGRGDNPSLFCLPFYQSFYKIISENQGNEVETYLSEMRDATIGSNRRKALYEIVRKLADALKEVQSLEDIDLSKKKNELIYYRIYCEQAAELMSYTEEASPLATEMIRKGLPILDRKLKSLLEEIQEKAKTACRESKGTAREEIACGINRKVQGWKASNEEEIALDAEDLLIYMKSNIPKFPENEHIFEKIKEIEDKKDLNLLLRSIRNLFEDLPKIMIDPERMKPTIGIITALPKEYAAVSVLLENKNDKYKIPGPGAGRRYCLGEILSEEENKHSLVLANAGMGNNIAATRASLLLEHFPNVKSIIMVGIAGGVPNIKKADDHVRLGDIVVSNENGVIQYDLIKQEIQEITHRNPPRPPSASLLEAVKYLEAEEILGNRPWEKYIDQSVSIIKTIRPSEDKDVLYCSDNQEEIAKHPEDPKRIKDQPRIFTGPIASANILQKDPQARDKLRDKFGVKAIEMEASGIADATWNHEVGYLVVRGICDYCDSHKNDEWQQYAAVVAAAYTRALIESMP